MPYIGPRLSFPSDNGRCTCGLTLTLKKPPTTDTKVKLAKTLSDEREDTRGYSLTFKQTTDFGQAPTRNHVIKSKQTT